MEELPPFEKMLALYEYLKLSGLDREGPEPPPFLREVSRNEHELDYMCVAYMGMPVRAPFNLAVVPEDIVPKRFPRGAILINQDAPADLVYWILKGVVRVYRADPLAPKHKMFVGYKGPHDLVGYEQALFNSEREHFFTVQACDEVDAFQSRGSVVRESVRLCSSEETLRAFEMIARAGRQETKTREIFMQAKIVGRVALTFLGVVRALGDTVAALDLDQDTEAPPESTQHTSYAVPWLSRGDLKSQLRSNDVSIRKALNELQNAGAIEILGADKTIADDHDHFVIRDVIKLRETARNHLQKPLSPLPKSPFPRRRKR